MYNSVPIPLAILKTAGFRCAKIGGKNCQKKNEGSSATARAIHCWPYIFSKV